jgi:uncharacterized protein YecE (DUF72 family)
MPKAEAMQRMLSRVPDGFVFTAKLTRTMTHEIDPKNWRAQVAIYRQGIAPLVQAGRLRAVLVQLGPAFERSRQNRLHLATCSMSWRPCLWSWSLAIGHGPTTRFLASLKGAAWPCWPAWAMKTNHDSN